MTGNASSDGGYGRRVLVLLAVVLAAVWGVAVLFHPSSYTGTSNARWLGIHYLQLFIAPFVAIGVLHVLDGISGAWALVARISIVAWAAWFSAFDAVAGIATGILSGEGEMTAADALFDSGAVGGTMSLLGVLGQGMWLIVALAAGLALRRSGAKTITYVAMFVSALIFFHLGPAAAGYLALAVALWTALPATQGAPVPRTTT
ncbi:MAG TPA: hypothetical protein VGC47_08985 [Acidimicrobiia bacterium]|jgi:hypothetical protein